MTRRARLPRRKDIEVHFTPEQQSRLAEIAGRTGKHAEHVLQEAVAQMLDEDTRFIEAVEEGLRSLDRKEFVEHEEVKARISRLLSS